MKTFRDELTSLINYHSLENGSDTPDFILADYLVSCLGAFDIANSARQQWTEEKGASMEAFRGDKHRL